MASKKLAKWGWLGLGLGWLGLGWLTRGQVIVAAKYSRLFSIEHVPGVSVASTRCIRDEHRTSHPPPLRFGLDAAWKGELDAGTTATDKAYAQPMASEGRPAGLHCEEPSGMALASPGFDTLL